MPDEKFRIIFEGKERNLDQVLKKIEKAFDQISNANPFEKINASMALMGKSMDEAVGKVSSGFAAVQKSLEQLTGTVKKIPVEKAQELGEKVSKVADTVQNATLNFGKMKTAIGSVAVAAGRAFEAIGTQVRGIEEGIGRAIGGSLQRLGTGLGSLGSSRFGGNLFSPILEGARSTVTTVVKSMDSLAQGVLDAMRSVVTGVGNMLGEVTKSALLAVGGVVGALTGMGPLVGAIIGNTLGGAVKAVADMATGAANAVISVASGLSSAITGAIQGVVNVVGSILNTLASVAQGVVEKISQAFSSLVGKVAGFAGGMVSKFALAFTGLAGIAAHQSIKFRDQMAVTFGLIARDGTTTFQELTSEVRAIMSDTPFISWTEGAKGLFQAISFGVREPTARIGALKASIDLALGGGMRELGTAVQGVARLMDQFGVSAREAADRLYTMQNQASLTVADLSRGIGQVLGSAKRIGDSISQRSAPPQLLDPEPRRRPGPLPWNHLFAVCGSPGSASSGARDAIRRPLSRQGPPLPPTRPSPAVSARSRPSRVRPSRCAPVSSRFFSGLSLHPLRLPYAAGGARASKGSPCSSAFPRTWLSRRSISAGAVITAITFISAPHLAQQSGSTSSTFLSSRAQLARLLGRRSPCSIPGRTVTSPSSAR